MNKQSLIMKGQNFTGLLIKCCVILLMMIFTSTAFSAGLDILVIGSSHSYSEGNESGVVQEKAFSPSNIATQLTNILSNDPAITDTVNVVVEDIYTSKQVDTAMGGSGALWNFTYKCYSLMQYFMWPDGKATRMANLRGEGGTAWDYVIIMGDPYLMANMPGVYAEGVKLLVSEISKGTATPILLAQWPENSSTFTANQFNEIVYRVGNSAGIQVVPAGKAWDTMTGQDTSANHPTPKGAYLAASAIYSKLYDKSAKTSNYTYNDSIADHALSVVQANDGVSQFTGTYSVENVFQMKYFKGRMVDWCEYGSSTEEGFADGLKAAYPIAGVSNTRRTGSSGDPVDFSYSRGTDAFEPDKQYDYGTRLDNDNWTYGFPMGDHSATGAVTMLYGIDKRFYGGTSFYNGTDLGIAYSMIRENQVPIDVRGIPVRLLWAKMNHANIGLSSHRDSWHLSNELNRAVGAYMYTMVSGRCPIEDEPADNTSTAWKQWFCRKLGYETAWQMSHVTTRAPGFRVLPTAATADDVSPASPETLSVSFINPPNSNVTVTITSDDPTAGTVSPSSLTFTPSNYSNVQNVTVTGVPGSTGAFAFNVILTTSSSDPVYQGATDSWDFINTRTNNTAPVADDQATTVFFNTPGPITLTASDGEGDSLTYGVVDAPVHGSLSGTAPNLTYTPDTDYIGGDSFTFKANDGASDSNTATVSITVSSNSNTPPTVNAGADQTVFLADTSWSPSDLNPELWLDADDASTVILNGGTVQQWNDKSGNGRNATQATATSQPTDTSNGLNGKHVLTFDGNSDFFGVDLDFMAGVDHSTFIVTKPTTYTDIYGAANASAGANSLHVGFNGASLYRMNYWGNDWNGTVSANFQAGSANILNYIWTSGTSKQIFANGKSEGTNGSAGVIGTMSGGGRIGAVVNHGNYGGDIAEFIAFSSALSQADRESMEGYLAHKWGLAANLPVGHPYKDSAPGAFAAVANLDGTVTDPEHTPTTIWSKVSGPGTVTFGDVSSVDTTAGFTVTGTYVLRLTADDGYDQAYDEITINVETITPHAADSNSDWSISQAEVNSFISSYSSNNNSVTGDEGSITDGRITMREVMRVIYLYNNGGAYIGGQGTLDGYEIEVVAQGSPPAHGTPAPGTVDTGDTGDGSLVVSSTADSGVGSLRNAIAIAGNGETIIIDSSIDTLTVLSEIVIDKSITIDGQGVAIVNGDKQTRVFRVENAEEAIDVSLKNMGIVDAENTVDQFGGAVYNNGQTLTLDTVLFDGNSNTAESGKGGAVYNSGILNVNNCVFSNNTASEENDVFSE